MTNDQYNVAQEVKELDPTVLPAQDFLPSEDCEELKVALSRCCCFLGCNEQRIINIICRRTINQRIAIAKAYYETFSEELCGNFKRLLVALMMPLPEYYAQELNEAMGCYMGFGAKGSVLSEILCTLRNSSMNSVAASYEKRYGQSLEQALSKNTYGYFRRLCISLVQGNRDERGPVNDQMARADAIELFDAASSYVSIQPNVVSSVRETVQGVKRWGTDEIAFTSIMVSRSYPQLRQTFLECQKIADHDIESAIDVEFSGDIKRGLLAIVKYTKNHSVFFADLLYGAMKGIGTDNKTLTRIIVSRCELDLGIIKRAFMNKYKDSLKSWIKGDTSGSYREALITLVGK